MSLPVATITRYTQILCFSVITEMDLEEEGEKLAEKSDWEMWSWSFWTSGNLICQIIYFLHWMDFFFVI